MKINIITNTFQKYHRQDIAVDSWRYLKQLYPDIIEIYNVQFEDEEQDFVYHYPDLKHIFRLTDTQKIIPNASKKLPFFKELFQAGLDLNESFIWTNSDVIITRVLIDKILNKNPNAIACSRLDIESISSFQSIIDQNVKPVRWEIAGIDTIFFGKEWANLHKEWFIKHDFVIGKFLFDCMLGSLVKVLGNHEEHIENSYPVACFHISHGITAVTEDCPERSWNLKIAQNDPMIRMLINAWAFNFTQNYARRTPYGAFINPRPEEKHIENTFFAYMNLTRDLT